MNKKPNQQKNENGLQYDAKQDAADDADSVGVVDEDVPEIRLTKFKTKLDESEKLQKEYLDGWQRARAELINYKKEEGQRFHIAVERALGDIIHDLAVVLDSFYMARQYDMPKNVAQGIIMIHGQLEDVLRRHGCVVISAKKGEVFAPSRHESVGEIESENIPYGMIVEEVQKGYELNGKVLRPARVKLSKEKSP